MGFLWCLRLTKTLFVASVGIILLVTLLLLSISGVHFFLGRAWPNGRNSPVGVVAWRFCHRSPENIGWLIVFAIINTVKGD
jgi:hypothetical protein